jgi:hypothetical protein
VPVQAPASQPVEQLSSSIAVDGGNPASQPVQQLSSSTVVDGGSPTSQPVQQPSSSTVVDGGNPTSQPAQQPSSSTAVEKATPVPSQPTSDAPAVSNSPIPTASLSESITLGVLAPSLTPVKDSAVVPAPTPAAGVVAPAQPVVNLSGFTLNSELDLGLLAQQTRGV